MTSRAILLMSLASLTVVGSMGLASSASALTMKECSAKYQAAKTAGTLNGQKWNDFRATQCTAGSRTGKADDGSSRRRNLPGKGRYQVCQRDARQGPLPYLRRRLQCRQGQECARRPEVDTEGRRLLQPLQLQAQGLIATTSDYRTGAFGRPFLFAHVRRATFPISSRVGRASAWKAAAARKCRLVGRSRAGCSWPENHAHPLRAVRHRSSDNESG